jgi:hypothetical protein
MKIKFIYIKLVILLILLFILFFILFFYTKKINLVEQHIKVKSWELNSSIEKLKYLKDKIDRIMIEDTLATQIVFSGKKQDFLLFLDFFDDDYNVKNANYHVSDPKKVQIQKDSKFYDVIMVKISMQFETNSELKLYMFLEELVERIPGYVYIQTLDFTKNAKEIKGFLSFKIYVLKLK